MGRGRTCLTVLCGVAAGLLCAAPAPQLREKLVSGAYGVFDEIVFATRSISTDPHWYANISYFCKSTNAPAYSTEGRSYSGCGNFFRRLEL